MEDLRARRYRACTPRETVERIRGILSGLELMPVESEWRRAGERFFSLYLSLPGTCIGVNGKGVTPESALASAYGELMERLQNMAEFRLRADMPPRAHRHGGFLYTPDEVPQSMGEILASEDPWIQSLWETVPDGTDRVSYLRRWKLAAYGKRQGDFYGIPFVSLRDGTQRTLPQNMLSRLYLTNGMCAGNTWEEALIHGLCECLERYAVRMVVTGRHPLRAIDRKRIGEMPIIEGLLRVLEEGGYAVKLYDASLDQGLPVAAALLTDRREGGYLVRFGASPDPEVAMERALTELMQGQRVERIVGMRPIHVAPDIADPGQNMMGILTHGSGEYPFACFGEEDAGELPDYGAATMAGTLKNLTGFIQGLGHEVLCRDMSFLGFPAAHVVVPGISEIGDFGNREELDRYTDYRQIKEKIRTLRDLSPGEAGELLLAKQPLPDSTGVLDILNLNIAENVPWYYRSVRFLKLSLALACGDMGRAAALLHAQAEEEPANSLYYRCARDVCLLRESTKEDTAIKESLGRFYPEDTVSLAVNEMRPDLYRRLGTIRCFDCDKCPYKERCSHPGTEKLYKQLKRRMREHYEETAAL